ncbi:GroES-like protein [Backusella circina FSU 941]|nr:GroES-like protein [Backusella circina FSU 941]
MDSGWGESDYPVVVGHEIVGVVTKVGENVTNLKVGDRAGVGAQAYSCHECRSCKAGIENICEKGYIGTYNSRFPNGDKTFGGYADKYRGDSRFMFKVPDNMTNELAACFFCAGVTTYTPLKRANVNENSVLGVMGLGGLGHFAVQWGKALGAKVVGMSHNEKKHDVALQLGCDEYLNTNDEEQMGKYKNQLTHILCTGSGSDFQWKPYFELLVPNGEFMNVSMPDWPFPPINMIEMVLSQVKVSASAVGSPHEIEEMLKFAAEKGVKPWIKTYPMSEAPQAVEDFRAGLPRFRFVLKN